MDKSTGIIHDPKTGKNRIKNFKLLKKLGQGQFGKVILAQDLTNKKLVAIKCIKRVDKVSMLTKGYVSPAVKIEKEIKIMQKCAEHPNLVKLYQVIDDSHYDKILLILEYCSKGELDWKVKRSLSEISKITRDVVLGLEHLHSNKIIHRDIKPSNLLMDSKNNIKISDFGVSVLMENDNRDSIELGKTLGTPAFFAPELCQFSQQLNDKVKKVKIDYKIDIWSLGCTLFCLVFNDLPFNANTEFQLIQKILRETPSFPSVNNTDFTKNPKQFENVKSLMKKLLVKDPNKRISLNEVKTNQFLIYDLSSKDLRSYQNVNKKLMEDSLGNRFRNMFRLMRREDQRLSKQSPPVNINSSDEPEVSDILDNYLDSSDEETGFDVGTNPTKFDFHDNNGVSIYQQQFNGFKPPNFNFNKSKMLSSSSSLNLNSYLADDNISLSINTYNNLSRSSTKSTSNTAYRIDKDKRIKHASTSSSSSKSSTNEVEDPMEKDGQLQLLDGPEIKKRLLEETARKVQLGCDNGDDDNYDADDTIIIVDPRSDDDTTPIQSKSISDYLDKLN